MKRRGVILVEVIAACGLAAVLLALCVQLLSSTALERRHIERRAIALQEAANLLERASTIPFDELSETKLADTKLASHVLQILPDATAKFSVTDELGDVPGKRVRIELRWKGRGGQTESPVRLTYWAFQPPLAAAPSNDTISPDDDPSSKADSGATP